MNARVADAVLAAQIHSNMKAKLYDRMKERLMQDEAR